MLSYYLAVTVDVCEHNSLYEHMNEYQIKDSVNLDGEVAKYAKQDIAPIVELYECVGAKKKLIKKYQFKEYECKCNS